MLRDALDWQRDGRDWPNREASRFVQAAGMRWHVQILGTGTPVLLLHGTGASTHSWRDLAPRLAVGFQVVAPDLPGHGFSEAPPAEGMTLPGMADAVRALLAALRLQPRVVVGHSAGAAVACRMSLDGLLDLDRIIGINAALLPMPGIAGPLFGPLARALSRNPLVPWLMALRARDRRVIEGLLRDTGSTLEPEGIDLYQRLASSPRHDRAALRMMASWDLDSLEAELGRLAVPLTLIVGENDRFVAPHLADRIARRLARVEVLRLPGAGHLAHEERPDEVAQWIGERIGHGA